MPRVNPAASVQVFPGPSPSWAAVSLPAEPELILAALLLAEELEHACPRQSVGKRGGLLLRARRPQAAQQAGHGVRVVEGDVGGGITAQQRGGLVLGGGRPSKPERGNGLGTKARVVSFGR